jgi:thioredoxin-related protein
MVFCVFMLLAIPMFAQTAGTQGAARSQGKDIFDPKRDAAADLRAGIAEAAKTGKRVLADVGGNWCSWCHEMERFVEAHPELKNLRDKYFVTVKINFSPDNKNEAVLSKFPKIPGYPHLFVLDSTGKLLCSKDTSQLEDGKSSYVLDKFIAFLKEYSPPGQVKQPAKQILRIGFLFRHHRQLPIISSGSIKA